MSEKGLEILVEDHIPKLKGQRLESCEYFLARKKYRLSFQVSDNARRRKRVLDIAHLDV